VNAPDSRGTESGTAYGRPTPTFRSELTRVGPGTPMGELLRRYWHPVGLANDASDTPRKLRVLGEDLILFRDGTGRPGLLYPRCMHRGTTLYYGRVEERGIRCCYHGWLYDVRGHCIEQPCEPGMGERRDNVRQPWYPLEERYGLIFAYLGPPERKPVLPRYDCLEELASGETIETDDTSIGTGGGVIVPCNWMQHYENVTDPFHVPILHGAFSGVQFVEQMAKMPRVEFELTPRGVKITAIRKTDDGKTFRRVTEAVLPTLRVVPNPRVGAYGRVESIGWVLPIDDRTFRIYTAGRVTERGALGRNRSKMNGKSWWDLSEEEHRRFPGDWEAQTGQGEITLHSEEHLRTSDKGIAMLRRLFQKQTEAVAAGTDPMLVAFDEGKALVRFEAGNFLES
jgi:phenylpropionate dioxygenase-like ring-hydroxylating dioxygenase large terminal subunit